MRNLVPHPAIVDGLTRLGASTRESVMQMCAWAREAHYALVLVGGVLSTRTKPDRSPSLDDLRDHESLADLVDTVLVLEP